MSDRQTNPAYYAVVPADVRYDPELRPNAKLLYGELTSLCNQKGYCWATNEYFAELYGLSVGTVSRLISQLELRGYIRCEMAATEKGSERRIYAGAFVVKRGLDENGNTPLDENGKGGLAENVKQNNKDINNKQDNTPYNPPEGDAPKPKPKRKRKPKAVPDYRPDLFENFWDKYPGGGSRAKAVAAWDELRPDDALIAEMAQALKRQKATRQWQEGIGIPHASTWLNGRRWTDKLPEPVHPSDGGGWAPDPEVTS